MRTHQATVGVAILGTTLAAGALAPPTPAETLIGAAPRPAAAASEKKLRGELGAVVRNAGAEERIPISIVMRDQLTRPQIEALAPGQGKTRRRAAVIASL